MASDIGFVTYVCEQLADAGSITHRRMFGEFAVYCDGKVVALVCDNQFFLKPTTAGRALLDRVREAPPYPGSKPYYLLDAELEDAELASRLVRATAAELPLPKPRKSADVARPARKTAAKKATRKAPSVRKPSKR